MLPRIFKSKYCISNCIRKETVNYYSNILRPALMFWKAQPRMAMKHDEKKHILYITIHFIWSPYIFIHT